MSRRSKPVQISVSRDFQPIVDQTENISGFFRELGERFAREYTTARQFLHAEMTSKVRLKLVTALQHRQWSICEDPEDLQAYIRTADFMLSQCTRPLLQESNAKWHAAAAIKVYVIAFWSSYLPAREL